MFYDCFNKNGAKDFIEILLSLPLSMAMEWTNNHDIALAWEVLLLEPYRYKARTVERGKVRQKNSRQPQFARCIEVSCHKEIGEGESEAKCGRSRLFTRNSVIHSESAISSMSNLSYSSYGNSKFFEKLQS